ncbi:MAG: UDP-N-acetylglucosamine 1-carboxyvinyltransferase [Alphaproteobacteria bacterium]|nr:UDP-N-acetylglucosamine 1-carboxyvinyltransferase [Alphaproteobacteria bacterium]
MDKLKIHGGNQLNGKIFISGAKNAALPLICASLLTKDTVTLTNMPMLSDIKSLNSLLLQMGTKIDEFDDFVDGHPTKTYSYTTLEATSLIAPYDYVRKMRASYYVLGPLLARYGHVELSLPGGCAIGARPMDIHLSALEQMGATIEIKNGYVHADINGRLHGADIIFKVASVGATCNILMAATLADGTTRIENAAKEPEIGDLIDLLNDMGAKISGRDTSTLTIEGVESLHKAIHKVIPDRIEAGSYAVAAAITRGCIELINAQSSTLQTPLSILRSMGVEITEKDNSLIVDARGKKLVGQDIMTDFYPGFPTDLQAQFLALMLTAEGASMVTETIWENRFMHVPELMRMGANINVHGHASAIVRGVEKLSGAPVMATDLRASFALVLAGLVAEGETIVNRVYHLDRGYEKLEEKLRGVGADIERIKESDEAE